MPCRMSSLDESRPTKKYHEISATFKFSGTFITITSRVLLSVDLFIIIRTLGYYCNYYVLQNTLTLLQHKASFTSLFMYQYLEILHKSKIIPIII